MSEQRIGIYPGTFDPITSGHCDIVRRALRLVDKLVVGVASNAGKGPASRGLRDTMRLILEEEGWHGLLKGMRMRVIVHMPAIAVSWTTYETIKAMMMAE